MTRAGRMLSIVAVVVALAVAVLVSNSNAWTLPALRACEMEALKNFGTLRKPNDHGVLWPPHPLEYYFITACMRAGGYVLDERPDIDIGRVGDGLRATYMLSADNWRHDYKRWLPKTLRDLIPR
jgi:hypothetical protein